MEIARHKGRGTTWYGKNIICQNMGLPELALFPKLVIKSLKIRRIRKKIRKNITKAEQIFDKIPLKIFTLF